jgi:hypothetical protein
MQTRKQKLCQFFLLIKSVGYKVMAAFCHPNYQSLPVG